MKKVCMILSFGLTLVAAWASAPETYPEFKIVRNGEIIVQRQMTEEEFLQYQELKAMELKLNKAVQPIEAFAAEIEWQEAELGQLDLEVDDTMTLAEIKDVAKRAETYAKEIEAIMQKHEVKLRLQEMELHKMEQVIHQLAEDFVELFELEENDHFYIIGEDDHSFLKR